MGPRARIALRALVLSMAGVLSGCAAPVSTRGTTSASTPSLEGRFAWMTCGDEALTEESSPEVVSAYRRCRIVTTKDPDDPSMELFGMRLGPAELLRKVDPAALVKALVRYDELHVVVHFSEGFEPSGPGPRVYEQVGCTCRGLSIDFDCPRSTIPLLLAHPDIERVAPWNRPYVHWR